MLAIPGAEPERIPNTDNVRTANGWTPDGLDISPDGSQIVWVGSEPGDFYQNHGLYVADIDGSNKTLINHDTGSRFSSITWGEENRILLTISAADDDSTKRVYSIAPDGSGLRQQVFEFSTNASAGGPANQIILSKDQANPYPVVFNNDFTGESAIPNVTTGAFNNLWWHPTQNRCLGFAAGCFL